MIAPAARPRPHGAHRLLVVGGADDGALLAADSVASAFRAGDLLVLNDAATVPASLPGDGLELRLLATADERTWLAALLGAGDHRTRTEDRPPPPPCPVGTALRFDGLVATVVRVHPESYRLVDVVFDRAGAALWSALYRAGRPVQYAHVPAPLALWDVQNVYAARPWAFEMPSAGRILDGAALLALRRRGVELATLTHAAGISAVGDPAIDALLPLPERYEVPAATWEAVARARARGGRTVAVGTSVVRALEGGAREGTRTGVTALRLGPTSRRAIVDGIVSGVHEPDTSHFALLEAFVPRSTLLAAHARSEDLGLLGHELGDTWLVWGAVRAGALAPPPRRDEGRREGGGVNLRELRGAGTRVPSREDRARGRPAYR